MSQFNVNSSNRDIDIYNNYRQTARYSIESISRSIEKRLIELENSSIQMDSVYNEIEKTASYLSSICSQSKSFIGYGYIQKIRAHVRNHRETHDKERAAFNVIHFLFEKLKDLESESIQKLTHCGKSEHIRTIYKSPVIYNKSHPFQYVSFERNDSFFIVQYAQLEIVPYRVAPFPVDSFHEKGEIDYKGTKFEIEDLLASSLEAPPPDPSCYLIVRGKTERCYAVDRIHRRYLSSHDFITVNIKKTRQESSIARGFVTLSGNRHIVLKMNS